MRRLAAATILVAGAVACIVAGWIGRGLTAENSCRYTASGYGRLHGDLNRLPRYPLENVSDVVVGNIQRCWAAHPYIGPQQSLNIIGAAKAPSGGYFLVFDPWGLTDTQIVFLVDARGRVTRAFAYSTI
jgi:hypothetical protein